MRIFATAFGLLLALQGTANAWYTYYRAITPGLATTADQLSFPLLIQLDSSNVGTTFKTAANGGHIQNTITQSGGVSVLAPADILFVTAAISVPWEVESYDAVNGVLKVWVLIPRVSASSNVPLYLFYGDASVTTQQNTGELAPANVWDSNYKGVWHLTNGTTLTAPDSTSNGNNGTLVNSPTATTGQIDGAASYVNASNQRIDAGTSASLAVSGALTLECWLNNTGASASTFRGPNNHVFSSGFKGFQFYVGSNVIMFQWGDGTSQRQLSSATALPNTIYHIAATHDGGTAAKVYTNGGSVNTGTLAAPVSLSGANFYVGDTWQGWLDEVRVSNIARSAGWIATEYANMNAPLTFNSIGAEITPAPATWAAKHRVIQ